MLEKTFCGSIDTTDPGEYEGTSFTNRLLKKADIMCVSSPTEEDYDSGRRHSPSYFRETESETGRPVHPSSALLARALVSEVTDNPKTMKPSEMAQREYKLLKAQEAAAKRAQTGEPSIPIGAPGGVGPPQVLQSFAYACTGDETAGNVCVGAPDHRSTVSSSTGGGPLASSHAGAVTAEDDLITSRMNASPHFITLGLCLSRRFAQVGHPDSVTRQTAYDFNELQDRAYKYVSSTDKYGWRAGGGEAGGPVPLSTTTNPGGDDGASSLEGDNNNNKTSPSTPSASSQQLKEPNPDTVHIPIIHIDCGSAAVVDQVIHALASGEIFIPHMSIQPESLSVQGISPPDLVVRFGCERNEDLPPDEWPNWCLEFMHNQLYEYFYNIGARWMKRPFSITLARKVRWKTVKHMNRYFGHCERVIEGWRQKGPQYLDPQLSYIEGGASPDEVARPHGIYLMRRGMPTNYFAPNFEPPYTTKMTRSLLQNVLDKSWDKKRREWSSDPVPKLVTPSMLMAVACGCADPSAGGFVANRATTKTPQPPAPAPPMPEPQSAYGQPPLSSPYGQPYAAPGFAPGPYGQQHSPYNGGGGGGSPFGPPQPYNAFGPQPPYHAGYGVPPQGHHHPPFSPPNAHHHAHMLSPQHQHQLSLQLQLPQQYWSQQGPLPQQQQPQSPPQTMNLHLHHPLQEQLSSISHVVESVVEFDTKADENDDDDDDMDLMDAEHRDHRQQQHRPEHDDNDDAGEEKKTDGRGAQEQQRDKPVAPDPSPTLRKKRVDAHGGGGGGGRRTTSDGSRSMNSSNHNNNDEGYAKSVAASATTVAHENLKRTSRLFSDEDWDQPTKENMADDPPGEKVRGCDAGTTRRRTPLTVSLANTTSLISTVYSK